METIQRISLYSYLHLKLAKMPCFSYYLLCFFFYKIQEKEGGTRFYTKAGRGTFANTPVYPHPTKKKNTATLSILTYPVHTVGHRPLLHGQH
jgi:hypothetical protein